MTDTTTQGTRARAIRSTAYACVPLLAILIAWFATREGTEADDAADHQHGAAPAASTAQPVMLTPDQALRIGVTYAVAAIEPLAREIRTVGQVTYDETRVRTVSLKVDGWVEELYVNFTGQAVAAGEPLLAIYSPMLVTAQEELLLARRLETDVAAGAAEVRTNAASLLSSARRRLAYWDVPPADIAQVERIGEVQRTLTLRAPVSGHVVERDVQQGQKVMAGEELYRIADLSTIWVEGEVFERDLSAVRLGQEVRAEFDALSGRVRTGRITYIYPTLNPETRTSRVRVALTNPEMQLKPGMYATLIWRGAGVVSALSVPRTAVISTGQRDLVFVKRPDGMIEPRVVVLGVSTSDRIEILSGLALGDTVVKSATFLLDAESNLGTLLGGMGNMPGMDMTAPTRAGAPAKIAPPRAPADSMPGMDMGPPKKPEESSAHANH
ncbi:MAG: efflux RND transporter periplasmic adaptor subunit [Gemmatimonadaceae bacterium]